MQRLGKVPLHPDSVGLHGTCLLHWRTTFMRNTDAGDPRSIIPQEMLY